MAARENRDQKLIDHLLLADDYLPQLAFYPQARILQVVERLERRFFRINNCRHFPAPNFL